MRIAVLIETLLPTTSCCSVFLLLLWLCLHYNPVESFLSAQHNDWRTSSVKCPHQNRLFLHKENVKTETSDVQIRLYDISSGLAPLCGLLLNKKIDAIWHAGISAYGKEYWFSTHIESKPLSNIEFALGIEPTEIFEMGTTSVSQEDFESYVYGQLAEDYNKDSYDVFQHNCNHFAADCLFYLNEKELPPFICEMWETALSNQGDFKAGLTKNIANQVARVVMIAWERANEERTELQNGVNKDWENKVISEIKAEVANTPKK